jgi:hypothetical protein
VFEYVCDQSVHTCAGETEPYTKGVCFMSGLTTYVIQLFISETKRQCHGSIKISDQSSHSHFKILTFLLFGIRKFIIWQSILS